MDVDARVGSSGYGRPHPVDNAENQRSVFLCQLNGSQRVGGFSTLADSYDDVVLLNHRVTITELTGIFHFHAYAAHLLNQLFPYQSCVPAGSTRYYGDVFRLEQPILEVVKSRQYDLIVLGVATVNQQSSAHTVAQALWLVKYLLEHKMVVALFAQLADVKVYCLDIHFHALAVQIDDLKFLPWLNVHNLLIIQINHLVSIFHYRSGIAGNEKLIVVFADAHY